MAAETACMEASGAGTEGMPFAAQNDSCLPTMSVFIAGSADNGADLLLEDYSWPCHMHKCSIDAPTFKKS